MNSIAGHIHQNSIIVGVDVHKYSHTAVAMDCFGQEKGRLDFSNDNLMEYVNWLATLGSRDNLIVALEDVNGYGVHLVEKLSLSGFPLRYVPAILTERDRRKSTSREKSDYLDAKRIGKVILTKYEETLPAKESIANRPWTSSFVNGGIWSEKKRFSKTSSTLSCTSITGIITRTASPRRFIKKPWRFIQKT